MHTYMNANISLFSRRLLSLVESVNFRRIFWHLCNSANIRWRAILLLIYKFSYQIYTLTLASYRLFMCMRARCSYVKSYMLPFQLYICFQLVCVKCIAHKSKFASNFVYTHTCSISPVYVYA